MKYVLYSELGYKTAPICNVVVVKQNYIIRKHIMELFKLVYKCFVAILRDLLR